jgi:uncharacterized protein
MRSSRITRMLLTSLGTVSLGVGIIGIFLPLIPTTPFLLLSAACYARSSNRFYTWLLTNKLFGSYITDYREGRGIPRKAKLVTLAILWLTISLSWLSLDSIWVHLVLITVAIGVTIHIITIRNRRRNKKQIKKKNRDETPSPQNAHK